MDAIEVAKAVANDIYPEKKFDVVAYYEGYKQAIRNVISYARDHDEIPDEEQREMCCDKAHFNEAGGLCCPDHYPNTCGYHG